MNKLLDTVIKSLLLSSIILCWSVLIVLNLSPIYDYSINKYHITKNSNLSLKEIKMNYNYIIDYINSPFKEKFHLPTLSYSKEGAIHFREVKVIFQMVYIIYFTNYSLFCSIFLLDEYVYNKNYPKTFLKTSCKFLLFFSSAAIIVFSNFSKCFDSFHEIFFNNNYWIFDEAKDPIINILPENFFYISFTSIIVIILINTLLILTVYRKIT
ncbi:TIGR01906 family membrane protein [Haloimpatiens sp. FM7315]|uniref:TIGR01906 family membrane protein n=1 Tax=Haloimpatiens sp. FM7315 TaxID=3298609 RepID=UPI0035A35AFE